MKAKLPRSAMTPDVVPGVSTQRKACEPPPGRSVAPATTVPSLFVARATELLPDARATAVASFAFMLFLGQAVGALAIGYAIARFGYVAAFWLDAVAIGLLTLWLTALMRKPPAQVALAR